MLTGKCTDSPLALKAAGIIQDNEPTFTIAKFLAQKNLQNDDNEVGIKYYEEAANLTEDNNEKAETFVSIARIQAKEGQKSTARNSARRALSYDPSYAEAYKLIGDLYMGSLKIALVARAKLTIEQYSLPHTINIEELEIMQE